MCLCTHIHSCAKTRELKVNPTVCCNRATSERACVTTCHKYSSTILTTTQVTAWEQCMRLRVGQTDDTVSLRLVGALVVRSADALSLQLPLGRYTLFCLPPELLFVLVAAYLLRDNTLRVIRTQPLALCVHADAVLLY